MDFFPYNNIDLKSFGFSMEYKWIVNFAFIIIDGTSLQLFLNRKFFFAFDRFLSSYFFSKSISLTYEITHIWFS